MAVIFWLFWEVPFPFLPYARMRMNTYEYFAVLTYVYSVAVLRRNHAPETGRGDDEATGDAQHTSNTINAVVRTSIETSPLLLRRNDDNSVTYNAYKY